MHPLKARLRSGVVCLRHPERAATFACPSCHHVLCDHCVEHRFEGAGFTDRCRECGEEVIAAPTRGDARPSSFVSRLPELFTFFANPGSLFVLGGLALIAAPLHWAIATNISSILGIIGWVLLTGLELSIFYHIVRRMASGDSEITAPDFADVWALVDNTTRVFAAFAPLMAVLIWVGVGLEAGVLGIMSSPLHLVVLVAALALVPMLLMRAALCGGPLDVLNVFQWPRSIAHLGTNYWISVALFYPLAGALLFWSSLGMPALGAAVPYLGRVLGLFVAYVVAAVISRLLGLVLEPHIE